MNKIIINKILEAAVQAPSGDNVQPWKFQVSDNFTTIKLYNLPEKDNSYYNYQQSASYIAHGALIENISIATQQLGCQMDYQLFPEHGNDNYIAKITLSASEPQQNDLYPAIFKRSTNRFQYQRTIVDKLILQSLRDSVKNIDTARVSLITDKAKKNQLAKELMVNDSIVFECKDIHQFLFDKIRWNKKQIEGTKDGMPVDVLGLSFIEKLSFPLMRFWWYVKVANSLGLSRIISLKCWWGCKNSSILGMVSIQGDDNRAFIEGGRAVQRLWLEATKQGFAMQPIIGLTLLINRLKKNNLQGFSEKHQKQVQRVAETLPELFEVSESETLLMGFRLGVDKQMGKRVRTLRKSAFK